MNILPFVVTILLVLSILSLSQFRGTMGPDTDLYLSYFKTLREARNQLASETYRRHHIQKEKKKKTTRVEKTEPLSTTPYFRNRCVGCKEGRLSLLPLLKGEDEAGVLREVALKYFHALYSHLSGYSEALLLRIIDKQRKHYQTYGEILPSYALLKGNKNIEDLDYRIIRGTRVYDPETQTGFPPFEHFFSFDGDGKKAIRYAYAPKLLLCSVFSPEMAQEIEDIEYAEQQRKKGRRSPCSAERLEAKVNEKMIPNGHLKIGLIDFSKKRESKQFVETDINTQITVWARPLSES